MKKLVSCYVYKNFIFSLLKSGDCESPLYFKLGCLGFLVLNDWLIRLSSNLAFILTYLLLIVVGSSFHK